MDNVDAALALLTSIAGFLSLLILVVAGADGAGVSPFFFFPNEKKPMGEQRVELLLIGEQK